ncbi:MAG: tRNA threonylcarbamoyladenosine dehydratase [Lewinellaceae bacterium]|nr:tRNA threonylcarbamoyladenosine dehydratase [Lewinellaceae bacterium]
MDNRDWLARTELLIGKEALDRLAASRVLVVGLGGVGSFAAEFLARGGLGHLCIVDGDVVDPSNKNRQLPALDSNLGKSKAAVMGQRLLDINPGLRLEVHDRFLEPVDMEHLLQQPFDYVLDCIDSFQPKLQLIRQCLKNGRPVISSMGAGGRTNPAYICVEEIWKTHHCPFAQQVRKFLKREGVTASFPVVFSSEPVIPGSMELTENTRFKKSYYGTISYLPALFGIHMSAHVIRSLAGLS